MMKQEKGLGGTAGGAQLRTPEARRQQLIAKAEEAIMILRRADAELKALEAVGVLSFPLPAPGLIPSEIHDLYLETFGTEDFT